MTTPTDAPAASTALDPRSRLVIGLLLASGFVLILNETVMSVAIRPIMASFGVTASAGQWLTTAFLLTMAVVIPVTGFLLRRLSTRTVFLLAMSTFTAGTLICATAPLFGVLVGGRVVQAVGTAMIMPLLMTTVMQLVPALQRGRIMGNISIVISVAPALGPAVSGAILSVFSWHGIFWLVLPLVVAMLVLGAAKVPNVNEPVRIRLDVVSVVLSALAFGGLIFGLSAFGEGGGTGVPPAIPIAVGATSLVVFVLRQRVLQRSDAALLDLRTFGARTFALSVALMLVLMGALFGTIILLPQFMQESLGLTEVASGLLLVPGGLTMGLLGPVVGRLYDKVGPRPLVVPGCALVALALLGMGRMSETTSSGLVVAAHVVLSVGLALTFTPLFTSALGSLAPQLYSHGSAIIGTVQQVAGATGTALFTVIMVARESRLLEAGGSETASLAGGATLAFTVGAALAAVAVPIGALIRRPPATDDAPVVAH